MDERREHDEKRWMEEEYGWKWRRLRKEHKGKNGISPLNI